MPPGAGLSLFGIILEIMGAIWLVLAAWKTKAEIYEASVMRIGGPSPATEHRWPGIRAARVANRKGAVGAGFVLLGLVFQAAGILSNT